MLIAYQKKADLCVIEQLPKPDRSSIPVYWPTRDSLEDTRTFYIALTLLRTDAKRARDLFDSHRSGLAELLRLHAADLASYYVVNVEDKDSVNTDVWKKALRVVLDDRKAAFDRAKNLREILGAKVSWEKAVREMVERLYAEPAAEDRLAARSEKEQARIPDSPPSTADWRSVGGWCRATRERGRSARGAEANRTWK